MCVCVDIRLIGMDGWEKRVMMIIIFCSMELWVG